MPSATSCMQAHHLCCVATRQRAVTAPTAHGIVARRSIVHTSRAQLHSISAQARAVGRMASPPIAIWAYCPHNLKPFATFWPRAQTTGFNDKTAPAHCSLLICACLSKEVGSKRKMHAKREHHRTYLDHFAHAICQRSLESRYGGVEEARGS